MTDTRPNTPPRPDELPTEGFGPGSGGYPISVANYRVRQLVAAGGMGEVYDAEQQEPVRRRVALKVIKLGMDTREVIARFESERQALALMNHSNIAKVFDGGITEQGRPFFAMEYVRGEPITRYCDRHRLGIRDRLELFLQVCEGVQHAHQKGIIHRDLKPSNVLVTVQDEKPMPKIIDFGVAKATSQPLTDKTMFTAHGALIGTPEYMSPEQAEMTRLDIDTRTDVYSLGVLLYELLVGALPFDSKELRKAGFEELRRKIREEDPSKPSTRISTLAKKGTEVAKGRNRGFDVLAKQLRGDLDWITMKALEKDRTRRYQTVNALALDIRRHLNDEPVRASPPSATYRARKFVRRHKGAVTAAVLVVVALLAGITGTTVGLLRALRAEQKAYEEAETARQVSEFLVDLFRVSDPSEAQGNSITAREILDKGAERITRELGGQPLTKASLMDTMGTVYHHLGLYEEAETLLEQAVETREDLLGGDTLEVAESLNNLAELYRRQGSYEQAQELARRALAIREAALGTDDPKLAESLTTLAWSLGDQGRHEEAGPLFERALALREANLDPLDPEVAGSQSDLGVSYWRRGDFAAAEPLLKQSLNAYTRTLGPDDYRIRKALNNLAVLYWTRGRHAEAEELYERSLSIRERALGSDHPDVASTLNNLALIYDAQEKYAEAEPLLVRAIGIWESTLGGDHDLTAMAIGNLAWIHYRQGEFDEAEPLYARALAIYERGVGPDHTSVAILLRDQSRLYIDQAQYSRAEELLTRAASIWEKASGPDHPDVADCLDTIADLYTLQGKMEAAEPLYQRALAIRREKLGPDDPAVAETISGYAELLRKTGRVSEAEELLRQVESKGP
jgi:non-specific serine/threonine protein kinase/serine/threonine-protein kinase